MGIDNSVVLFIQLPRVTFVCGWLQIIATAGLRSSWVCCKMHVCFIRFKHYWFEDGVWRKKRCRQSSRARGERPFRVCDVQLLNEQNFNRVHAASRVEGHLKADVV